MLPPENAHENKEPNYAGPDDVEVFEGEEGWMFETDLEGVKEHIKTFPFLAQDPAAFTELFRELENMLPGGKLVQGWWPAKIILATRR